MPSVDLLPYLNSLREQIDAHLTQETLFTDDCPKTLSESVQYSLLAPGKRVRPCLVLMSCEACGGEIADALPAASALEMVHSYSLIHDDLPAMDDDDLRRGRPTNHVQFGESTAILAGDGLLTRAFEVLANSSLPAEVIVACIRDLASAAGVEGMVGGQQADLEAEQTAAASVDALEAIHRRKTGRLLTAALTMGARIAHCDPQMLRNLKVYGESVGLAFQIADDLLDVTGDVQKMGKEVQKDAEHHKSTYPSLLGVDESRMRAESLIQQACAAVEPLGERNHYLQALARYIIDRDH